VADAVENVNVDPPPLLVGVIDPDAVDDMLQSAATPVVAPVLPDTVIVHPTVVPARAGLVLLHDTTDAVVGVPYTTNDNDPPVMACAPTFTVIANDVVVVADAVENVNVDPPLLVVGAIDPDAVDETVKSLAIPKPTPFASRTVIVHAALVPARAGLVLLQDRLDAVVGVLYTMYDGLPPLMVMPPTCTVMTKAELAVVGVVENVYVDPPLPLMGVIDPDAVDETEKSPDTPVVAPVLPDTVIVHEMAPPTRGVAAALQDKLDAVVGVPYTTNVCVPPDIACPPV